MAAGRVPLRRTRPEGDRPYLAWLSWSDGLANIDLGVAWPDDMDAFERRIAARRGTLVG